MLLKFIKFSENNTEIVVVMAGISKFLAYLILIVIYNMDVEYLEILLGKREASKEILKTRDLFADFLRFVESEKLPYYKDEQLIEECKQEIKDIIEAAKEYKVKISKEWLSEDNINNFAQSIAQEHIKKRMWDHYYCATEIVKSVIENHPIFSGFEGSKKEELIKVLRNMLFLLPRYAQYRCSPTYQREVENLLQKYRNW